ncbi:MAG: hypothetical protein M1840_006921 [Geoglossum simile]|nr:MAG: hypothetical protein M1840_006921 [Geoglossum simile]
MLDSGTNPSIQTEYDWAPLHWAASYGHADCVELLIQANADLSVISDQSVTPLDLALRANETAAVDLLIKAGAKESRDIIPTLSSQSTAPPPQDPNSESKWINIDNALTSHTGTARQTPDNTTFHNKLLLVFDKPLLRTLVNNTMVSQFIYPRKSSDAPAPPGYIYQISHVLETPTSTICIRKSHRRAEMNEYPLPTSYFNTGDVLYDTICTCPNYQEFELRGKHQSHLPGTIRMNRD